MARSDPRDPDASFAQRYRIDAPLDINDEDWIKQAHDALLDRTVTLKALRASLSRDPAALAAALAAARRQAQLQHPGIAPVHGLGLDADGHLAVAISPLRGTSLRDWLDGRRQGQLERQDVSVFLAALLRVCETLDFVHERGLVHAGLEPRKLFLDRSGMVRLLGWSTACRIGEAPSRSALGDPRYWSPEQARGGPLDRRADVFALGAILYEFLAGVAPYGRLASADQALELARNGRVTPPEEAAPDRAIPAALSRLALAALEAEPERRLGSAGALRERLESFLFGAWHTRLQRFAPGADILEQGAEGRAAYVIEQGEVQVLLRDEAGDHLLATLGPGDTFGEMALLLGRPHAADVRAESEVLARVIDRRVFEGWFDGGAAAGAFFRFLAQRIRSRDQELLEKRRLARVSAMRLAAVRAVACGEFTLPELAAHLSARGHPCEASELEPLLPGWGLVLEASQSLSFAP